MQESDPLLLPPDVESPGAAIAAKNQNYRLGVLFALLTACCTVGASASTKLAGKAAITPYTSNFTASVVGTLIMTILLLIQQQPFMPSFQRWQYWFFGYGVALWFFMWGGIRALHHMDLSSWQSMTSCLNQALIVIIAAAFLGEAIDMYTLGVVVRNAVVIVLISKPPCIFGGSGLSLGGLAFLFVQCMGASIGSAVQKHLCDYPTESLLFWGFLANVFYWLPPGVSPPQVRMPGLWPPTGIKPPDDMFFPWLFTLTASTFSACWFVFAGYGLKQMNAADFFLLLVPITLVLSCFVSITRFHESIDRLSALALAIIAFGFVLDHWWRSKSQEKR